MRWFKHFNDALDDPFIQELMDKYSHAGYVAWFGLLEIIAKENGTKLTGKLTVDPRYLKRKLRISTRKLEQIFEFCSGKTEENLNKTSTKPKLLFNKTLEKWDFEVCKMLELKDNYTKDLQAPSKKPPNHKEAEAEEEEDNNPPTPLGGREDFFKQVQDGYFLMTDYLQRYPEPKLEADALEVIEAVRATRNPNSTRGAERHEIEAVVKHWLCPGCIPKENLIMAAQGGDNDFDKKMLTVDYLLKPTNYNRLIAKYEDTIGVQEQAQEEWENQRKKREEEEPKNIVKMKDRPEMMELKEALRVRDSA